MDFTNEKITWIILIGKANETVEACICSQGQNEISSKLVYPIRSNFEHCPSVFIHKGFLLQPKQNKT